MAIRYKELTRQQADDHLFSLNQQRFFRRIGFISGLSDTRTWEDVMQAKDQCWVWVSTVYKAKRGAKVYKQPWLWIRTAPGKDKQFLARRAAFYLVHGHWPLAHENVISICKDELCVNPYKGHNEIKDKRDTRPWNVGEPTGKGIHVVIPHRPDPGQSFTDQDEPLVIPSEEEFLKGSSTKGKP